MEPATFQTTDGTTVPAVTADEMRAVDRVAVEALDLGPLQMMENAGRTLAWHVRDATAGAVTVLAGAGGNGGGGLCCARHLENRRLPVSVVLDRHPDELEGAPRKQYETLAAMDVPIDHGVRALSDHDPSVVVDALVGYGLSGPLRGTAGALVEAVQSMDATVVSLDVPSGENVTTGERAGPAADPDRVVTLALPKTGLSTDGTVVFLADIAIPTTVYDRLDIPYESPFRDEYGVRLTE